MTSYKGSVSKEELYLGAMLPPNPIPIKMSPNSRSHFLDNEPLK